MDWPGGGVHACRLRAVDLYCGSEAVTAGLAGAFDVVAAVDNDPVACETYAANHQEVRLFRRDIRTMNPREIVDAVPSAHAADLLIVCAPYQPFSSQNRNRAGDGRAVLVLEAARFAAVLRPRGILFENVPGLAGTSGLYEELRHALAAVGYIVGLPRRVDAADMGVPQRRIRCVMFASRSAEAVERFAMADLSAPRTTVAQAIRGLLPLESGQRDPDDPMHAARRHSPLALRRLHAIPHDGGSRDALPEELRLRCHVGRRGFPDVYGRMRWNDVAPTLTTGWPGSRKQVGRRVVRVRRLGWRAISLDRQLEGPRCPEDRQHGRGAHARSRVERIRVASIQGGREGE